ncbi:thiamine pyrophosphate-dependent enzyme [Chelativorans sp. J32]|uniref:thiamine pyrophosphate-dependent enzyme n=1 Tax=Chelativorans sp. J32 TaxID=935840 RepID=UPI0004B15A65|nr:thiamine pyrophosphate-dependent enzyme [Chelativorans sp. J32]
MSSGIQASEANAGQSGAEVLAGLISAWNAGPVFHVPGEGILELLDALDGQAAPGIDLVTCRHEGGMAYMAQASGRLKGTPGICLAARAPGALNATLALHTAQTDAAPMIMIIGQAGGGISDRDPLLGSDLPALFAPVSKWVAEVTEARRLPEYFARAWHMAISGRPGPVVLVVRENVWAQEVGDIAVLPCPEKPMQEIGRADLKRITHLLSKAERPLTIVGGSDWDEKAAADLAALAASLHLPVATAYRRRDMMDNDHPSYVGELGIAADRGLQEAVRRADLVFVLGMKLGEINTFGGSAFEGFSLLDVPVPKQVLIHVHPAAEELNRAYQASLSVCATPSAVVRALASSGLRPRAEWEVFRAELRAIREAFAKSGTCPGPVDLKEICAILRAELPDDAIVTVGAGSYALWPQRYFGHRRFGTQMGPKSGAMGYGLPAAIGVKVTQPERVVVALAGDGCFMMHGEELATAVLHNLPIVTIVVNNAMFGAINASQKRMFGRAVGTELSPVNFADYARALGADGHVVEETGAFLPALRASLDAGRPAVIDLRVPPEALRPA